MNQQQAEAFIIKNQLVFEECVTEHLQTGGAFPVQFVVRQDFGSNERVKVAYRGIPVLFTHNSIFEPGWIYAAYDQSTLKYTRAQILP